jgi:hypothetical protein
VGAAWCAVGVLIALGVGFVILSSARTTQRDAGTQHYHDACSSGCLRATFGAATSPKPAPGNTAASRAHSTSTPRFLVDPGTGFAVPAQH